VLTDDIHRLQQMIRNRSTETKFSAAQSDHQVLSRVEDAREFREIEQSAIAFEGVHGAKQTVQRIPLGRALLQPQQLIADLLKKVMRLGQKLLQKLRH
jgi:hypothetical protein